jgi:hypothetical protein
LQDFAIAADFDWHSVRNERTLDDSSGENGEDDHCSWLNVSNSSGFCGAVK